MSNKVYIPTKNQYLNIILYKLNVFFDNINVQLVFHIDFTNPTCYIN